MLDTLELRKRVRMALPSDEEKTRETYEEIRNIDDELLEKYDIE